jgi:hypothetical protein
VWKGGLDPFAIFLNARWLTATLDRPATFFTFDYLNMFKEMSCYGKVSAYDFYKSTAVFCRKADLDIPVCAWCTILTLLIADDVFFPEQIQGVCMCSKVLQAPSAPQARGLST